MRKFLVKILIIGMIILMVLAVMELSVRSIPNEYSYKYEYLEKNMETIQILTLGSSVGRSGIDPDCFDMNTFNAANVSQDIETDCAIIDKYLPRAKNLKTVIFTLLPGSYYGRMCEGIENWRLRKYSIYMDLDIETLPKSDQLEISNVYKTFIQILTYLSGQSTVDCFEKGMGKDSKVETDDAKLSQAISITKIHNAGYKPNNYNIVVPKIRSTINKLTSNGIEVYLVLMPVHHTYAERINKKIIFESDSISKVLESQNHRVHYYNMFTDSIFNTEDFRNSNHLSPQGAKKLCSKINEIIKNDEQQ